MTNLREKDCEFKICLFEGVSIDDAIKAVEAESKSGIKAKQISEDNPQNIWCFAKGHVYESVFSTKLVEKVCDKSGSGLIDAITGQLVKKTHTYIGCETSPVIPAPLQKYVKEVKDVGEHYHFY